MCLIVKKSQQIETAKEDIVCYKILQPDMTSLVQNFPYKLNDVYRMGKVPSIITSYTEPNREIGFIFEGFHSWTCMRSINDAINYLISIYKSGSYANAQKERLVAECNVLLVAECIIPKGSKYYTGSDTSGYDSYTSEQIQIMNVTSVHEYTEKYLKYMNNDEQH